MSAYQLEAVNLVHSCQYMLPPDPVNLNIISNTDNLVSREVLKSGSGREPCSVLVPDKFGFFLPETAVT